MAGRTIHNIVQITGEEAATQLNGRFTPASRVDLAKIVTASGRTKSFAVDSDDLATCEKAMAYLEKHPDATVEYSHVQDETGWRETRQLIDGHSFSSERNVDPNGVEKMYFNWTTRYQPVK